LPWATIRKKMQQGMKPQTAHDMIRAMKAGSLDELTKGMTPHITDGKKKHCGFTCGTGSPHLSPFVAKLRTLPTNSFPDYAELENLLATPLRHLTGCTHETLICDWQAIPGASPLEPVYCGMQQRSSEVDYDAADEAELRREQRRIAVIERSRGATAVKP
jgi:hypothetical protein